MEVVSTVKLPNEKKRKGKGKEEETTTEQVFPPFYHIKIKHILHSVHTEMYY